MSVIMFTLAFSTSKMTLAAGDNADEQTAVEQIRRMSLEYTQGCRIEWKDNCGALNLHSRLVVLNCWLREYHLMLLWRQQPLINSMCSR